MGNWNPPKKVRDTPLPNRLQELREASRLTQAEVGKLIDRSKTQVASHETGHRNMQTEDVVAYAQVYKVMTHEIFLDLTPKEDDATE